MLDIDIREGKNSLLKVITGRVTTHINKVSFTELEYLPNDKAKFSSQIHYGLSGSNLESRVWENMNATITEMYQ